MEVEQESNFRFLLGFIIGLFLSYYVLITVSLFHLKLCSINKYIFNFRYFFLESSLNSN
jgi:hypothetical protein